MQKNMNMKFIHIYKDTLCLFYIFCDICTPLLFSSNNGQSLSHWAGSTGQQVSLVVSVGLADFLKFNSFM